MVWWQSAIDVFRLCVSVWWQSVMVKSKADIQEITKTFRVVLLLVVDFGFLKLAVNFKNF